MITEKLNINIAGNGNNTHKRLRLASLLSGFFVAVSGFNILGAICVNILFTSATTTILVRMKK